MDAALVLTGILFFGFLLKIAGFLVRDELWLRALVACGLACDVVFYGLRTDPVMQSVLINLALVSINLALIALIVSERTTWRMSKTDRDLFSHFVTLSPGQFRRLRPMMRLRRAVPGETLMWEGQPVDDLALVLAQNILIAKAGDSFPISGPSFVGEIALLTGNPSSADVTLPDGGEVVYLDIGSLKQRMARSPSLNNAMVALFGAELARKVADSVPMDRAAHLRPVAVPEVAATGAPSADPAGNPATG